MRCSALDDPRRPGPRRLAPDNPGTVVTALPKPLASEPFGTTCPASSSQTPLHRFFLLLQYYYNRALAAPTPLLCSALPPSPAYPAPITLANIPYRNLPQGPRQLPKGTSKPSRVCGCIPASVRCAPCALHCRSGGGKLGRDGAGLCRSPLI